MKEPTRYYSKMGYHPSLLRKRERLIDLMRIEVDLLVQNLYTPTKDLEKVLDEMEEELVSIIDKALLPEKRNSMTTGVGEDEMTFPCFLN